MQHALLLLLHFAFVIKNQQLSDGSCCCCCCRRGLFINKEGACSISTGSDMLPQSTCCLILCKDVCRGAPPTEETPPPIRRSEVLGLITKHFSLEPSIRCATCVCVWCVWHVNNCILLLLFYLGKNIAKLAACNVQQAKATASRIAQCGQCSPQSFLPHLLPFSPLVFTSFLEAVNRLQSMTKTEDTPRPSGLPLSEEAAREITITISINVS